MENIKFEESFVNGGYKEICEQNHEIIENKYFEIFGKEDYEIKKEQLQKSMCNRVNIFNNLKYVKSNEKHKTVEEILSEPQWLHILPYVRKQVLHYFKKQGHKVENIEQYLKLCQE